MSKRSSSTPALGANEPEATTKQATKTVEQAISEAQVDETPESQLGPENGMAAQSWSLTPEVRRAGPSGTDVVPVRPRCSAGADLGR